MPLIPENIPENSESYFSHALPQVEVSKITLDVGQDPDNSAHYYSVSRKSRWVKGTEGWELDPNQGEKEAEPFLGMEQHYKGQNSSIQKLFVQDPHIESPAGIMGDDFPGILDDPGPDHLNVSMQLNLKLVIPRHGDLISSFLFNDDFVKYFKFYILQNTGPDSEYHYELMLDQEESASEGTYVFEDITSMLDVVSKEGPNVRSFSGTELINDSGFVKSANGHKLADNFLRRLNKKVDGDGNTYVDVPYEIRGNNSFVVGDIEPEHLSYFLISTVDVDAIKSDYPDLDDLSVKDFGMTVKPLLVINNKKVAGDLKIFKYGPGTISPTTGHDYSGQVYRGPVHKHPGGIYMTGKYHTKDSLLLDVEILDSVKTGYIQDFRTVPKAMKAPNQSHMNYQKVSDIAKPVELKHLTRSPTHDKLLVKDTSSCFSNLFHSRDLSWNAFSSEISYKEYIKFFFSINFYELLMQNSIIGATKVFAYMGAANNNSQYASYVNGIFDKSKIIALKLWRKKVKLGAGINPAGLTYESVTDFEKNATPVLVADMISAVNNNTPDPKQTGTIKKINNFVTHHNDDEINMLHNEPFMLHFSGHEEVKPSKHEVEQESKTQKKTQSIVRGFDHPTGDWSYYIELEFIDATARWLGDVYNELLESLLIPLEEYYYTAESNRSNGRPYFNIKTGRFHPDFIKDTSAPPTPTGPGSYLSTLVSEINSNKIDGVLYRYISLISIFETTYGIDPMFGAHRYKKLTEKYNLLLNPNSGATPTSIKALLDHVQTSINNLETFLKRYIGGSVKKEPIGENTGITPVRNKLIVEKTFKIKYDFNSEEDIVNFDLTPRVAFDYLNMGPPNSGLLKQDSAKLGGSATQGVAANAPKTITSDSVGLASIFASQLVERFAIEHDKYFNKGADSAKYYVRKDIGTIDSESMPVQYDSPFLTVSTIHYKTEGGPEHHWSSGIAANSDSYYFPWFPESPPLNWKFYNNLFMKAVRFNNGLSTGLNPYTINDNKQFVKKLSPEKQIARNELINLLSNEINCTVENIDVFKTPQSRPIRTPKEQDVIANAVTELSATEKKIQADAKIGSIYQGTKSSNITLPKFCYDDTDPTPELSQLVNYFLSFTESNFVGNFNEKFYDLNSQSSIKKAALMAEIPNQIKALIVLMTDRGTLRRIAKDGGAIPGGPQPNLSAIKDLMPSSIPHINLPDIAESYNINDISESKFRMAMDRVLFPFFYFYFFNISEVQILSHYEVAEEPFFRIQMKSPKFQRVNNSAINRVGISTNGMSVCRQVKYSNGALNIFNYDEVDLPIYNEHFILSSNT